MISFPLTTLKVFSKAFAKALTIGSANENDLIHAVQNFTDQPPFKKIDFQKIIRN